MASSAILASTTSCLQAAGLGEERELADSGSATGSGGEGGVRAAQNCSLAWIARVGGPLSDYIGKLAPDDQGGVYMSGSFSASLDLGGGPLANGEGSDTFLARFDAEGEHVWSKAFGGWGGQGRMQVNRAHDGGLVIAGSFQGEIDFGDGPHVAVGDDGVVARFDADGNHLWSRPYTGPNFQGFRALTVDASSGDIYLGGLFHESFDFAGIHYTTPGESDGFIAKLDADGNELWARVVRGETPDYVNGLAFRDGRLAAVGTADGTIDLGEGPELTGLDGVADGWVAVYDTEGEPVWTRVFTAPGDNGLDLVALDASGDLVTFGLLRDSSVTLDGLSVGATDGTFLVRLTPDGEALHARAFENLWGRSGLAVGDGTIVVGSAFVGDFMADSFAFTAVGDSDGLVLTLDSSLTPQAALRLGDGVAGVAVGDEGYLFASAEFQGPTEVADCGSFQSEGGVDILLARLAP